MIRKLLCFFGLHEHIEVVDVEMTKRWFECCPDYLKPTPCTFLECKHCGHTYESRTVGISGKVEIHEV